jgi:hypothetical protein
MNSDSAIFCSDEENMIFYEENKKRKHSAKIQFCAIFPICAKPAQDYVFAQIKTCAIHKVQSFALRVGGVRPCCPCPYSDASVDWAASRWSLWQ